MKRINKKARKEILEKALKEKDYAGMWMMGLLPKSCERLTKLGISLENDQSLRSIHTTFCDKHFMLFLLDGIDLWDNSHTKKQFWAFWEVYPKQSKYCNASFRKGIWKGYLPV